MLGVAAVAVFDGRCRKRREGGCGTRWRAASRRKLSRSRSDANNGRTSGGGRETPTKTEILTAYQRAYLGWMTGVVGY